MTASEKAKSNEVSTVRPPADASKSGIAQAMILVTSALHKLNQADELLSSLPDYSGPSETYLKEVVVVSRTMRGVARVILECLRRQAHIQFVAPTPITEVGDWLKSQVRASVELLP